MRACSWWCVAQLAAVGGVLRNFLAQVEVAADTAAAAAAAAAAAVGGVLRNFLAQVAAAFLRISLTCALVLSLTHFCLLCC